MRRVASFLVWFSAAGVVCAQTPVQPGVNLSPAGQQAGVPVALNPQINQLNGLLGQWEAKMNGVKALRATITLTETDSITKGSKVFNGEAKLLRPDRGSLYLKSTTDPNNDYRYYVYTGLNLYEYLPQTKKLRIHEMAIQPGKMMDDNFLNFLFGMKAEEAKRRYDLKLEKEDTHYYYLVVAPRTPADQQDFSEARLALLKATFLPREMIFIAGKGRDTTKWDIPQMDVNARITTADFNPPEPPKDWEKIKVPRQPTAPPTGVTPTNPPAPTKVRPAGP